MNPTISENEDDVYFTMQELVMKLNKYEKDFKSTPIKSDKYIISLMIKCLKHLIEVAKDAKKIKSQSDFAFDGILSSDKIRWTDPMDIVFHTICKSDGTLNYFLNENPRYNISETIINECEKKCDEQMKLFQEHIENKYNITSYEICHNAVKDLKNIALQAANAVNEYCYYTNNFYKYVSDNIENAGKGAKYIIDLTNAEINCSANISLLHLFPFKMAEIFVYNS